jgi:hypothetical protein
VRQDTDLNSHKMEGVGVNDEGRVTMLILVCEGLDGKNELLIIKTPYHKLVPSCFCPVLDCILIRVCSFPLLSNQPLLADAIRQPRCLVDLSDLTYLRLNENQLVGMNTATPCRW